MAATPNHHATLDPILTATYENPAKSDSCDDLIQIKGLDNAR